MKKLAPILCIATLLVTLIAVLWAGLASDAVVDGELTSFDEQVRASTEKLSVLAIQHIAHVRTLDAFARDSLFAIWGSRDYGSLEPTHVILSWALCPDRWSDRPIIKIDPIAAAGLFGGSVPEGAAHVSPEQLTEALGKQKMTMMGGSEPPNRALMKVKRRLSSFEKLRKDLRLFPRAGRDGWLSLGDEASFDMPGAKEAFEMLTSSLETLDAELYKRAASELVDAIKPLEKASYPPLWRRTLELAYSSIRPFWLLAMLYILVVLLYVIGWYSGSGMAMRASLYALWLVAGFHLLAIVCRGVIASKYMASNTYEYILTMTAITACGALILRHWKKEPLYVLIGSLLSGAGLAATVFSPLSEAIPTLPPVLRSEWMTFHVGAAVFSYGALYLSFGVSLALLLLPRRLRDTLGANLSDANFRLVRLGFFLLGLGIITGGIWADRAWGRYWGWDPKESWSLVTWCVYGVFLHLRFCLTGPRRTHVLAAVSIAGFVAILFTFIGVNYILSGLHSYG